MSPSGNAHNIDWVFSCQSNIHVANHRDWFVKFTPFKTSLTTNNGFDYGLEAEGIGTVKFVCSGVSKGGPCSDSTIVLDDVAYCPKSTCNIVGLPIIERYNVMGPTDALKVLSTVTNEVLGHMDSPHLPRLRLRGQNAETTIFMSGGPLSINACWDPMERERWIEFKNEHNVKTPVAQGTGAGQETMTPKQSKTTKQGRRHSKSFRYTATERAWLKRNYKSEWYFLRSLNLSIHKEEDRLEGGLIVRAMIEAEDKAGDNL